MIFELVQSVSDFVVSPWWLATISIAILILSMVSFSPLNMDDVEVKTTASFILTRVRRVLILVLIVTLLMPLILTGLICAQMINTAGGCTDAQVALKNLLVELATPAALSVALGRLIRFIYDRYLATYYSHLMRRFRFKVSDERLSDIRDVAGKIQPKNFNPPKFYKHQDHKIFLGLNEHDNPVYLNWELLKQTHTEIIGPTGTGKGVVAGVILDQIIAMNKLKGKGNVVIAVMPKPDLWLPHIMKAQAEASGCRFMFFDMNPHGEGQWSPFTGGTARERRARVMSVLGMGETGNLDDFYKLGEKSLIDQLLKTDDFTVRGLREALERAAGKTDGAKRSVDTLREIEMIQTFNCRKDRGIKLEHILTSERPTVIYVNSSLSDNVILKMTKAFILEITQLAISLKTMGRRSTHLTLFCDELRFLISDELDKALATLAMYDTNVISAYQSPHDLEKVGDVNLNGPAIAHSVHTNNQIKLIYRVGEFKEAEWAAGQTGTQYKTIASRESTEVNKHGGETWGSTRMLEQKEEWYFTENLFQALPSRVGVLIVPGQKAQVLFTSFVPTTQSTDFYHVPYSAPDKKPAQCQASTTTDSQASKAPGAQLAPKAKEQGSGHNPAVAAADSNKKPSTADKPQWNFD